MPKTKQLPCAAAHQREHEQAALTPLSPFGFNMPVEALFAPQLAYWTFMLNSANELNAFVVRRLQDNLEDTKAAMQCASVSDLITLQQAHVQKMVSDYCDEATKIAKMERDLVEPDMEQVPLVD